MGPDIEKRRIKILKRRTDFGKGEPIRLYSKSGLGSVKNYFFQILKHIIRVWELLHKLLIIFVFFR